MDDGNPRAESVLVRGNRIAAVGSDTEVASKSSPDATRYDLGGRTLIPGFNDNHIHTAAMGNSYSNPDLLGMSKKEIIDTLIAQVIRGKREWIIANNWDYPSCPDPHRSDLDRVFTDRPVVLFQFSGHAAWCNSEALRILGITRNSKDWDIGGGAVRDVRGEPTGILREPYRHPAIRRRWVRRYWNRDLVRLWLRNALPKLSAAGITSVQDNTWFPSVLTVLRELEHSGELAVRFSCWVLGEYPLVACWMNARRYDEYWYRKGPMKYFLDGAFSPRTAWLSEDYADDPGNRGDGRSADEMVRRLAKYVERNRQVAAHAIGDRATAEYCEAIERLAECYPDVPNLRVRIEHAQLVDEHDFERIRRLGIYVCAQPSAAIDIGKDRALLGESRAGRAYPYRSLIDAGVSLSFGSDFPGESTFEPLRGIQNAVSREGPERITVAEALRCYTIESARAEGTESWKGSITSGKVADLVVLDSNPEMTDLEKVAEIPVDQTIVDGKVVFNRR